MIVKRRTKIEEIKKGPSDPSIGMPAMKGRRWTIDWYGSGKSYPKISKKEKVDEIEILEYKELVQGLL